PREARQLEIRNKTRRLRGRIDKFGVLPVTTEMATRPSVVAKVPGVSGLRSRAMDSMMKKEKAGRKRHWDPNGPDLLR
ncbi:MAG: hypothetical protein ACR2PK_18350, partial [Acidimicrobiales bacterium]